MSSMNLKNLKKDKKTVLLVGGGGYIGLVISKQLSKNGMSVIILDNLIYKHYLGIHSVFHDSNISFINSDIRSRLNDDFFNENNISDVVILAGLVGDPITKKYPDLSSSINSFGIQNLISDLNGKNLDKVIFISTCSNYGMIKEGEKADEKFPLTPLSLYAKHKVASEEFLLKNSNNWDFSFSILRFATAFGVSPRMRFDLSVNEFVYEAFVNKKLEIYDPDTWRPYCHVLDFSHLIELTLLAPNKLTDGEIFNAGGDSNNHTKRDLVEMIGSVIPNLDVNYDAGGSDPRNYIVDFTKVKNRLGFEPLVSVEEGIKEIITYLEKGIFLYYKENKNFYGNFLIEE